MACEECRNLQTHEFGSSSDLLHALQVAASEVDRGALRRVHVGELTTYEREALQSSLASEALPGTVHYRFECTVCGDRFELCADVAQGTGSWTRQEAA